MLKQALSLTAVALGLLFLNSCAKNNDSDQVQYTCPAGTTFYNGACYTNQGQFVTPPAYNYSNGFYADTYSKTSVLRLTNTAALKDFFKYAMGVCDRAALNYGQSSCDAYARGAMDIIIQFPNQNSNTLLATFIAQPSVDPYFNYSGQLPSGYGLLGLALGWTTGIYLPDPKAYYGAYRNPLQVELTVSLINNSAGFSANGYGDAATGANTSLITIEVPNGKIQDSFLNFNFKYKGTTAAQGRFTRCKTQNCGLLY